ncbi:Ti-type conjugative transfer relaxase TraA [Hyphomicrobium sp. 2TAF46]|uniref:Ti-type conjugative transfer relaxase TraA n=1 Tax=Hyphomicrobium sp. 2TAF46 TaxID=3233019 RepID=UPI003F9188BD
MAIAHFSASFITAGRSPVAAAAYRHRTEMTDHTIAETWSFTRETDLVHAEMSVPLDAPQWVKDIVSSDSVAKASEQLWNAVAAQEKRRNGQFAREFVIALPLELTRAQNIDLVRAFIGAEFAAKGMIADWVYHDKPGNPHVHVMHTLRVIGVTKFGAKRIPLRDETGAVRRHNGVPLYRPLIGTREDFKALRLAWGALASRHLALAGYDAIVETRSFAALGLELPPSSHRGPSVTALRAKAKPCGVDLFIGLDTDTTAAKIIANPALLLDVITTSKATFSARDIARAVHRYSTDKAAFDVIMAKVMASPDLVTLRPDIHDPETGLRVTHAVYSSAAMVRLEAAMITGAIRLKETTRHGGRRARRAIVGSVDGRSPVTLSDEQRHAVAHVTGAERIAAVVGIAGAGKSTMLDAAQHVWTASGKRVLGAALAGKAAEGLEKSSGIPSRTIAAWEYAWSQGRDGLNRGDVLVLDEAGMVSSKQMATLVAAVERAGAKLVLVGDAAQLQPIEAGAAFRAIVERIGAAELTQVRRQRDVWQQQATRDLSRGNVKRALAAYRAKGAIRQPAARTEAIVEITRDYLAARVTRPASQTLILAHSNAEVFALNQSVRVALMARGELNGEQSFVTARGVRSFAPGDRVLFLENRRLPSEFRANDPIAVKNGMLGTVIASVANGLTVAIDGGGTVAFDAATYAHIDHGYAATIHKSQGVTVDQTLVLAAPTMDRHLAYVALSRHREAVTLYAPIESFIDRPLEAVFSRSGAKSSTLDYAKDDVLRLRGFETLADIIEAIRAFAETQRQLLVSLTRRLADRAPDSLRRALVGDPFRTVASPRSLKPSQEDLIAMDTKDYMIDFNAEARTIRYPYNAAANEIVSRFASWDETAGVYRFRDTTDDRDMKAAAVSAGRIIAEMGESHARAEKIIAAYQPDDPSHSADLKLGIHNARLHLTIPPGMEAARMAAKEMGAHWDAKNKRWTVEVVANSVNLVENGLPRVAAAIHAAEHSQTLAKTITASDPRIAVSFEGDTVFVRTPNMPSANQDLKGAGFTWRDRQSAYGVVPLSSEHVAEIEMAFASVTSIYDKALVPPTVDRTGIEQPPKAVAEALKLSEPDLIARYSAEPALAAQINRYLRHMEAAAPAVRDALRAGDTKTLVATLDIEKSAAKKITELHGKLDQAATKALDQSLALQQAQTRQPAMAR